MKQETKSWRKPPAGEVHGGKSVQGPSGVAPVAVEKSSRSPACVQAQHMSAADLGSPSQAPCWEEGQLRPALPALQADGHSLLPTE